MAFGCLQLDDLHVVDADDGDAVPERVQRGKRFEVANDELGSKSILGDVSIDLDVLADCFGRGAKIPEQAPGAIETVAEVAEREPVDLLDSDRILVAKPLLEEAVGSTRNDDSDLVPGRDQVRQDDGTPRRVPHPFADDAVQNPQSLIQFFRMV